MRITEEVAYEFVQLEVAMEEELKNDSLLRAVSVAAGKTPHTCTMVGVPHQTKHRETRNKSRKQQQQ